jgi:hypothetical protein
MKGVLLPFKNNYAMPGICCACGAQAGMERFKLNGESIERVGVKYRTTKFTLMIPLCDQCFTMRSRNRMAQTIGICVGLLVGGVVAVAVSRWHPFESIWLKLGIPLLIVVVFMGICLAIGEQLHLKKLSPEAASLSTRLGNNKVAKMLAMPEKGKMFFAFDNVAFLEQFETLNGGLILDVPLFG